MSFFNKSQLIIFFLIVAGCVLRFYNLSWGEPYFFHPDERNIASSASQLSFPGMLNPHFFAYGSLPIYVIFFSGIFVNVVQNVLSHANFLPSITFEQAIIISRFYSSFLSVLIIPLLYLSGRKLSNENTGLIAAVIGTFNVGFIQFAHFGTFEIWLTFFTILLFWVCLNFKNSLRYFLLSGVLVGVLVSIKVSSIIFLPIPFIPVVINLVRDLRGQRREILKKMLWLGFYFLVFLLTAFFIYLISNPYAILDFKSFEGSIKYESGVGFGSIPVFYTGEFFNSIPVLFQLVHVLPFLLNPVNTIIFIIYLGYFLTQLLRNKESKQIILLAFFIFTFFSQTILFVKWVRYVIPSIPFFILIISFKLGELSKKRLQLSRIIISLIILSSITFSISYFITAFVRVDSRMEAYAFAQKNLSPSAKILSETYDLGIIPFNEKYSSITLFNFYDLDDNSSTYTSKSLSDEIKNADFIILPSQRVYKVRLINKSKFPLASLFYRRLFSGKLGFEKIYETPCDLLCKVTYLGSPIYSYEQTANVFDRPVVMIYKKI